MFALPYNCGVGVQKFISGIESPARRDVASHWNDARRHKQMPTWTDLSLPILHPHFSLLWGFHYDRETGSLTGRLAGKHIKEWLGANFWGAKLEDIHPPHVVKGARAFLGPVVTAPSVGKCAGRLFTMGDETITGERIALPLALNGINADGILGASDFVYPANATGAVVLIHENMEWCVL